MIGSSVRRVDHEAKVTGRAQYLADMKFPGVCCGKILRSPIAHGRIRGMDASAALRVPGVLAVVTRDDFLNNSRIDPYYGPVFKDQSIVALDKVRFMGDPVAGVAAVTESAAEEALAAIQVDYEELPAVFDVLEARREGAPLVHEIIRVPPHGFEDLAGLRPKESSNICTHFQLTRGDVERGFAESDHVFEDVFTLPDTQHSSLEAHAVVAWVEPGGRIVVWSTTQNPFVIRTQLSNIFRVPVSQVRVLVPYIGGGYGGKLYPKLEPLAVALALKAQRPVRIVLSREEVFLTITKHAAHIRIKTGVKNDGTLWGRECEVLLDTGAYAEIGPRVAKKSGYTAAGPYRIPHVKINSYCMYTHKPPAGAFRGFGVSQSAWACESQMDIIAAALKMDPLELRLKNAYEEGDTFATGETLTNVGLTDCIKRAARAVGWGDRRPRNSSSPLARGKGLACLIKATITPSLSSALVKMNEDGSVNVYTGTIEVGQGSETVLSQIVAEELGLTMEQVRVAPMDTDVVPYDLTTSSSRSTFHMGKAMQLACQDLKGQLRELASQLYKVPKDQVRVEDGKVTIPDASLSYREILCTRFGMSGGNLVGQGVVKTSMLSPTGEKSTSAFWFLGAGAAEVEVDRETGRVRVLKYASAADVGKAIHPLGCRQQLEGAAVTGVGQTFFEQMVFDNGQLINPNFIDYVLPSLLDVPEVIESLMVEVPHPEGPFGAKGIGETGLIPVAPAIANAIYDAVGVRIKDLPITPEKIFMALQAQREGTTLEDR
ncbi:MAG: xanthine dehydrogenase family protein molybdopterin-binding subunit [Acidobacteria bacterium]|nr:xanthine dehydrogenase family protein molybdopterin-binding subunit [Acidobacteriota bacterium]